MKDLSRHRVSAGNAAFSLQRTFPANSSLTTVFENESPPSMLHIDERSSCIHRIAAQSSLAAGGISNLYYPASSRDGAGLTFENTLIGIGGSAVGNLFQEFLIRKLTPHAQSKP
jgi:hypothetical protein